MELIAAVITLVTRMHGINTELGQQLAGLRRKRPRSETLERLEPALATVLEDGEDARTAP